MKNICSIIIIILYSAYCLAESRINPNIYNATETFIISDHTYTVPECRKLLLQDINQLGSEKWIEISGTIQISENMQFNNAKSHFISGAFTYGTGNGLPGQKIVVYPGSSVKVISKGGAARIPALEFSWLEKDGLCKPGKS